jgi:hypothetical protein
MPLEDTRKQKIAKLLIGLNKDEIQEILKEQARIASEQTQARGQREMQRLKKREAKLSAELEEVRNKIADIQGGKEVRGSRGKGNVSGRPFEELVLTVLSEMGQPARPKDIRDSILSKGWYEGSKVSLGTSVATTLSALIKAGRVARGDGRRYSAV